MLCRPQSAVGMYTQHSTLRKNIFTQIHNFSIVNQQKKNLTNTRYKLRVLKQIQYLMLSFICSSNWSSIDLTPSSNSCCISPNTDCSLVQQTLGESPLVVVWVTDESSTLGKSPLVVVWVTDESSTLGESPLVVVWVTDESSSTLSQSKLRLYSPDTRGGGVSVWGGVCVTSEGVCGVWRDEGVCGVCVTSEGVCGVCVAGEGVWSVSDRRLVRSSIILIASGDIGDGIDNWFKNSYRKW